MKSEYKEKAEELFELYSSLCTFEEYLIDKGDFIKAMCQLAEEVKKSVQTRVIVDVYESIKQESLYTKEQVEELLQKQRESCAEYIYEHEQSFYCLAMKNTVLRSPIVKF
jgi:hypothetical protein